MLESLPVIAVIAAVVTVVIPLVHGHAAGYVADNVNVFADGVVHTQYVVPAEKPALIVPTMIKVTACPSARL